ncbi:hypothetical protein [Sphingobacterium siyangense]|uniref:hypothetical protein n=2 Tax=Sphingobacterium siyangense TaxID=459529 RepID=UPI003DA57F1C
MSLFLGLIDPLISTQPFCFRFLTKAVPQFGFILVFLKEKMDKNFLMAIEISEGYTSVQSFQTSTEAFDEKKKSEQRDEYPIFIYDLSKQEYLWFDEDGPAYYETIAEDVIKKANR